MQRLLALLALFCSTAIAEQVSYPFDIGHDKWTGKDAYYIDSPIRGMKLVNADASMMLAELKDGDLLQFNVRQPQSGDNFTYVVEVSKDNGITWESKDVSTVRYVAAAPVQPGYITKFVQLRILGPYKLRLRIDGWEHGELAISDVSVSPLTNIDRTNLENANAIKGLRQDIEELRNSSRNSSWNQVVSTVNKSQKVYSSYLSTLSKINEKTTAIDLQLGWTQIGMDRAKLGNPMEYSSFKTIVDRVKGKLDKVGVSLTDDVTTTFSRAFQNLATVGVDIFSGNIPGLVQSFKNILANGYSRANLKAGCTYYCDVEKEINQGFSDFNQARNFLDIVVSEANQLASLANKIPKIRDEAKANAMVAKELFIETVKLIDKDAQDERIEKLLNGDKAETKAFREKTEQKFAELLGHNPDSFDNNRDTKLKAQRDEFLGKMNELTAKTERAKSAHEQVISDAKGFIAAFDADLKRPNPFQKTGEVCQSNSDCETWQNNRDKVKNNFAEVKVDFEKWVSKNFAWDTI